MFAPPADRWPNWYMNNPPKPHHETLTKRNLERIEKIRVWVSHQTKCDAWTVFERILVTFGEEAARIHASSSPREVAWAVRNIYELRIFMHYAFQSDANLKRLLKDYFVEGEEVVERMYAFSMAYKSQFPGLATIESEMKDRVARARDFRQEKFPGNDKHLNVRTLAKDLSVEAEYDDVYKIASKLVHPTAFSILKDNDEVRDFLLPLGLYVAGNVVEELEGIVKPYGFNGG